MFKNAEFQLLCYDFKLAGIYLLFRLTYMIFPSAVESSSWPTTLKIWGACNGSCLVLWCLDGSLSISSSGRVCILLARSFGSPHSSPTLSSPYYSSEQSPCQELGLASKSKLKYTQSPNSKGSSVYILQIPHTGLDQDQEFWDMVGFCYPDLLCIQLRHWSSTSFRILQQIQPQLCQVRNYCIDK